jgi:hypothetical protein
MMANKSTSNSAKTISSLFVWLVADGWCWFVLREKYCWLVAGGWFVLREKYSCLVVRKPGLKALTTFDHHAFTHLKILRT